MPDHRRMRTLILSAALIVTCVGCAASSASIERREADAIADDFYRDFQHEEPKQAAMLGSLSVQVHDDGWHYRWACKTSKDSGLGVFVGRNGQADYDEAPSCAGHELH